jgi:hypothetical protein
VLYLARRQKRRASTRAPQRQRNEVLIGEFFNFLSALLRLIFVLLPWFSLAWLVTFFILVAFFRGVKNRVRARVTHFDETLRTWAHGLRFHTIDEATLRERVARTWFFRFWTNFASAPSLSFFSVMFPFWMFHNAPPANDLLGMYMPFNHMKIWLFPGLCYAGSMLLSFVIKRVFKRVRPPRKEHAFGYKL